MPIDKLKDPPMFASVVPGRSPKTKYSSLGMAKSAVAYVHNNGCRGGRIYMWDVLDHEWLLMYDIPEHTKPSELPWKVNIYADYEAEFKARETRDKPEDLSD